MSQMASSNDGKGVFQKSYGMNHFRKFVRIISIIWTLVVGGRASRRAKLSLRTSKKSAITDFEGTQPSLLGITSSDSCTPSRPTNGSGKDGVASPTKTLSPNLSEENKENIGEASQMVYNFSFANVHVATVIYLRKRHN